MNLDISKLIDDGFSFCADLTKQAECFDFIPEFQVKLSSENQIHKLIHGDNLLASTLLHQQGQKFQLIYIDPPYASNSNYNLKLRFGDSNEKIKIPVYSDYWRNGLQSYLSMLFPRLFFMQKLLEDKGAIFVHVDTKASHYVKVLMDSIFGAKNLANEIIYRKDAGQRVSGYFPRKHDVILFYAKDIEKLKFNVYEPLLRTDYNDTAVNMHFKPDKKKRLLRKYPSGKKFYKDLGKLVDDIWDDISTQQASSPIMSESTGFETQKPTALLERIISSVTDNQDSYREKLALQKFIEHKQLTISKFHGVNVKKQEVFLHNWTNEFFLDEKETWLDKVKNEKLPPADTVADFFSGSGTTGVTAHQLKRNFVLCEVDRTAWYVSLKRLLSTHPIDLQCSKVSLKKSKFPKIDEVAKAKKISFVEPPEAIDSMHQKRKAKPQTVIAPARIKLADNKNSQLIKIEVPKAIEKQLIKSKKPHNIKHNNEYMFDFCIVQKKKTDEVFTAIEKFKLSKISKIEYKVSEPLTSQMLENSTLCIFDIFGNMFIAESD